MKNIITLFLITSIGIITNSCNEFIFRDVYCRDFELDEYLDIFPGEVGDNYNFIYKDNIKYNSWDFTIDFKEINHRTKYTSDINCFCEDKISIKMSNNTGDAIYMEMTSIYVEDDEAFLEFYLGITRDNKTSTFYLKDIIPLEEASVNGVLYKDVKLITNKTNPQNSVEQVMIAPKYGIIEIIENDGSIWQKTFGRTEMNWDKQSFDYITTACEQLYFNNSLN